eukprot:gnl/TRDRNA2_/TRDRNA2_119617_c0_seq1.p1 gnl/TRDRNA2_/TRDRNA2_119617_c0~~gnl/TRDRNA2_/TRDRNA2_119617_c0_seq1.p1  ORF type:complete len:425 (-),score=51.79 gnl/TRDRNA2_/TRDRNA2_119617_c0_seq1:51-1166(-)
MLAETVAGLPVVHAQKSEAVMYRRFCSLVDQNATLFLHTSLLMPWLALHLEEMVAVVVLTACGSALLLRGTVDPGLIAVGLTNSMALLTKVQLTCRASAEVENLFTAAERLSHILRSAPKEETDHACPPPQPWPAKGHVCFEAVSVRYRPELPLVLDGLSFEIGAGKAVGLIGPTGSGKSSCLRALLRLAELEHGRILIDSVDVRTVPLKVLRNCVASVPQEPLVLSDTLRRNLLPEISDRDQEAECWTVLDMLGLGKTVREWSTGLDTDIRAGEGSLSVGQRQLLGLGRALLRPCSLLCMDEATANVDGATDMALQRALRTHAKAGRRTWLMVAHRLWTLRHCDEVLVLSRGPPTSVHYIYNPASEAVSL